MARPFWHSGAHLGLGKVGKLRSTRIAGALAALLLGLGLQGATANAGTTSAGACRDTETSAVDAPGTIAAQALTCLVNRARAERGLRALRRSAPLARAARTHSGDMVAGGFFSHVGSDGRAVRQRAVRAGYARGGRLNVVGETLGWGAGAYATPSQLFVALMRSEQHRLTLLDRRFRDIGVGLVRGAPGMSVGLPAVTATVVFGRR